MKLLIRWSSASVISRLRYGNGVSRSRRYWPTPHGGILHSRQLVQLGLRTRNHDGNTTLCMASGLGYKLSFGSGPARLLLRRHGVRRPSSSSSAPILRKPPILCHRLDRTSPGTKSTQAHRRRSARPQNCHDGRHPPRVKPRSDIALLNGIAHILIRESLIDRDYIDRTRTASRSSLSSSPPSLLNTSRL